MEYYAGFDGDFEIHIDSQNKTDSNHNVEIPYTDYGRRTYNPTLKYVGPTEGISKVEWKDNFGFTFTANAPNFSTQGRAIGDEYPGQKNTYNMKVYYTNGGTYPGTGDPEISHYINVIETSTGGGGDDGGGGSGQITFTPNSSSNISGNREGWVNSNINVNVKVTGDTTKRVNGSTSWRYTY